MQSGPCTWKMQRGRTLPCRGQETLGRLRGYLRRPRGSHIRNTSSPVDLINTRVSRSASIWDLTAQVKRTRRQTLQWLVLTSQFLENCRAGLGREFVLPSQGADPRSSRIIACAQSRGGSLPLVDSEVFPVLMTSGSAAPATLGLALLPLAHFAHGHVTLFHPSLSGFWIDALLRMSGGLAAVRAGPARCLTQDPGHQAFLVRPGHTNHRRLPPLARERHVPPQLS